jgi:hypothetical protein
MAASLQPIAESGLMRLRDTSATHAGVPRAANPVPVQECLFS